SPTAVLMDNFGQGRLLSSSSLAAVLTATRWADRCLGASVMLSLPVLCAWVLTASNPRLSDELLRRTIRSMLDAATARPHMRRGFRHEDLLAWAKKNRSSLVHAILTLIRAWWVAGRPRADVRLGMYESWCDVVGGVLHVAGVEGLRAAIERDQGAPTE